MEIKKLEDVAFSVNIADGDVEMKLQWRNGELYLAVSGIMLGVEDTFYEIPIKDVEKIEIVDEKPLKLRFTLKDAAVTVTGRSDNQLKAVRHLLLPFVSVSG